MKDMIWELKKLTRTSGFLWLIIVLLASNLCICLIGVKETNIPEEYQSQYFADIEKTVKQAQRNKIDYGRNGENYLTRYQDDIIDRYGKLLDTGTAPQKIQGWDIFLSYHADDIFLFLFAVFLGMLLFIPEKDNGTDKVLYMVRGGQKTFWTKIGCAFLLLFLISAVFGLETLAMIGFRNGLSGIHAPIYSAPAFEFCPYGITVGEYLLIAFFMRLSALFFVTLLSFLTSVISKSLLLSVTFPAILLALGRWMEQISETRSLPYLNPYSFGTVESIFVRYRSVDLFSQSVPLLTVGLLLLAITLSVLIVLGKITYLRLFGNDFFAGTEQKIKQKFLSCLLKVRSRTERKRCAVRHGLFFYECKKHLFSIGIVFLCILALFVKGITTFGQKRQEDAVEKRYYELCTEYAGELTEEKECALLDTADACYAVIDQYEVKQKQAHNGMMPDEEYEAYLASYNKCCLELDAIQRLQPQLENIREAKANGQNAEILYDTGWKKALSADPDWILYAVILLILCGSYSMEYASGMADLIKTTGNGERLTARSKLKFALFIASIAFIVFECMDFLALIKQYPLLNALSPVASIIPAPLLNVPLYTAIIVRYLLEWLSVCIFAVLNVVSSKRLKYSYLTAAFMICVWVIAYLLL